MAPASSRQFRPGEDRQASSAPPAVALADDLMADIAAALHDRPMQGLVASWLMLEPQAGQTPADGAFHERGLAALKGAGEQIRQILWALDRSIPDPERFEEDLRDSLGRAADPERGLRLVVEFADSAGPPAPRAPVTDMVDAVVAAIHDVVVDAVMRGGTVSRVDLQVGPDRITAMVNTSPGRVDREQSPWIRLARARLQPYEGSLTISNEDEDITTVQMAVDPTPGPGHGSGPSG